MSKYATNCTETTKRSTMNTTEITSPSTMDLNALAVRLANAAPSAGQLDELVFDDLSAAGCLDAVLAWERLLRHAHAGLVRGLAALARHEPETGGGGDRGGGGGWLWLVESELCAALAWSPATAQARLADAHALTRLFPDTLHQLSQGQVSIEQARALTQLTAGLDDLAARAVETRVLPRMAGQSAAVTRQAIRRAVLRADPDAAANRHRHERARRRVELRAEDDGMATLSFYLPADVAQMAMRTLTTLAQGAKRKNNNTPADTRTLDQRRADLLPALLHHAASGANPSPATLSALPAAPAHINVVVSIETLLGLSHEPGHLTGYGPLCPEQTRRIASAHTAQWRFLLTSTDGTLVDASPRTYTPRAAIKRLTQLKHTTCVFPHCHMPADRCDLDHNQPFNQGGPTTPENLTPLCRRHHNHKTHNHWKLNRTNDTLAWTSHLTGRDYTTTPTRYPVAAA
ncbi:HNH endonuclease signature motif containing protein [Actinocrinis sp.]|uniref:HNH endonuclease signature motif containing protein n=1 Tax=Actinocrinis sp. TaxID=1920516 RepID=UPI002DDCB14F|nr:DUF222 domain-containing protein [Actinocrinis sp.]